MTYSKLSALLGPVSKGLHSPWKVVSCKSVMLFDIRDNV